MVPKGFENWKRKEGQYQGPQPFQSQWSKGQYHGCLSSHTQWNSQRIPINAQRPHKGSLVNSIDHDQRQNAASDQNLHCLHLIRDFYQTVIIKKNLSDTHTIGNGLVQKVDVEESTWHKWEMHASDQKSGRHVSSWQNNYRFQMQCRILIASLNCYSFQPVGY